MYLDHGLKKTKNREIMEAAVESPLVFGGAVVKAQHRCEGKSGVFGGLSGKGRSQHG